MSHQERFSQWEEFPTEVLLRRKLPKAAFLPDDDVKEVDAKSIIWRLNYRHQEWLDKLSDEDIEACSMSAVWKEVGSIAKERKRTQKITNDILSADLDSLSQEEKDSIESKFFSLADQINIPFSRVRELVEKDCIRYYGAMRFVESSVRKGATIEDPEVQKTLAMVLKRQRQEYDELEAQGESWEASQHYHGCQRDFLEVASMFLGRYGEKKGKQEAKALKDWFKFIIKNEIKVPVMEPYSNENEQQGSSIYRMLMGHSQMVLPYILKMDKMDLFDDTKDGGRLMQHRGYIISTKDLMFLATSFQFDGLGEHKNLMQYRLGYSITRGIQAELGKNSEAKITTLMFLLGAETKYFDEMDDPSMWHPRDEEYKKLYERIASNFSTFEEMIARVTTNYPVDTPLRDEYLSQCWALWVQFHPDQKRQSSDYLLPLLNGQEWKSTGTGGFGAIFRSHHGKPYGSDYDGADYIRRLRGRGLYTKDYDSLAKRRYPYTDSIEFPWTYSTGISHGQGCSFSEYFIAHRLLEFDGEIEQAATLHDKIAIVYRESRGIMTPARDTYIEYLLRDSLLKQELETQEDVEQAISYFRMMTGGSQSGSGLAYPLLTRLMDVDHNFSQDFDKAVEKIVDLMPDPGYLRNKVLRRFEVSRGVTPDQVRQIKTLSVDDLALSDSETKFKGLEVSFFELVAALDMKGKEDLLLWLIDKNKDKPKLLKDIEDTYLGSVDDLRDIFYILSNSERTSIIQRIVIGPDGVFSKKDRDIKEIEEYSEQLSQALIRNNVGDVKIDDLRIISSVSLSSVPAHRATKILSNILNKAAEFAERDEEITTEETLHTANSSFNASGIKASQLIADYPWVDPVVGKVFQSSMSNAEIMPPSEILEEWESESDFFQGYEILEFIEPLGSASMRQSYLTKMRFPDGTEKLAVLKSLKQEVVDLTQIHEDVGDIQVITENLERKGYRLDMPKDFGGIIGALVVEERDTHSQARFQQDYKDQQIKHNNGRFVVPEIYGVGNYIVLEEYILGDSLGNIEITDQDVYDVLLSAVQDLYSGMIHLDPHGWNIKKMPDGQKALLDFGMRLDMRNDEAVRQSVNQLVYGLLAQDRQVLTDSLSFFGVNTIPETENKDFSERIEEFRKVINSSATNSNAVVLHKLLWWMYRLHTYYQKLTPESQQALPLILARMNDK